MFKGKPTKVIITGNAKDEFDDLNKIVVYEIKKGVSNSVHQILLNSILWLRRNAHIHSYCTNKLSQNLVQIFN